MAAGATYTPIASTTIGTAVASYTFSSISGAYTDLVLVTNVTASAGTTAYVRPNSDTSDIYSFTQLYGTGSAAASGRGTSPGGSVLGLLLGFPDSSNQVTMIMNLNNYSNTTTYKTSLSRHSGASNYAHTSTALWRSTAAITSLMVLTTSGTFSSGSTFALYGIAAA